MQDFFDYPFNSAKLIRARSKIRQLYTDQNNRKVRIYILSGSTLGELPELISLFLLRFGIEADVKVGEYGSYYEEAVFGRQLQEFSPDWVYLHTSIKNVLQFPNHHDQEHVVEEIVKAEVDRFSEIIKAIKSVGAKAIINNFEKPELRYTGAKSASDPGGNVSFIRRLNLEIDRMINEETNAYLNDLEYLSSVIGLDDWYDWNYWSAFKYAMAPTAMPLIASSISSLVASGEGATKKLLVCDLDNTLWGGVVGDDGVNDLKIGPETAQGEMHAHLQSYIKKLSESGATLAVNSKNEKSIAHSGFDHEHSILSLTDFASFMANWDRKSENIQNISQELNLSIDSMVFIDDNHAEISEVLQSCPGLTALTYKKTPIEIARAIDRGGLFDKNLYSDDDSKRNLYYQGNHKRQELQKASKDIGTYLSSLAMRSSIKNISTSTLKRSVQLINKTNQFNATTIRTDEETLKVRLSDPNSIAICADLSDRFGDNGIVSILLADQIHSTLVIHTWVMSCRVFNRTLEVAMMEELIKHCISLNIETITAFFSPTPKNNYVNDLYEKLGFSHVQTVGSKKEYKLDLNNRTWPENNWIEVEYD